ncbi:hypothetical protein GQ43DRAFT_137416 [Delitschia confertaspora ATCC 74209]|uniref:RRM domain-containing protein n=1 Tax=Delitschia confertaspora ATCC 74209 TaxID=1513339 RepID=A0A9P4MN24_9PLEO|nr:hypothetical protein GQ43DRAFT_137416 [Delitschia confertaspora ATCC 74209]
MADDDNFDIDIYGDDASPEFESNTNAQVNDSKHEESTDVKMQTDSHSEAPHTNGGDVKFHTGDQRDEHNAEMTNDSTQQDDATQQISSTGGSAGPLQPPPKQAPIQQGMKRKQGADDDRPVDPGASSALLISDLQWWTTEDDVRGWANQSGCEDELIEITFSEHKVNGKSKGQVYVQMKSPQAATALKHQLESYYQDSQQGKKPSVVFNPAHINPFKTLPKDVPTRDKRDNRSSSTSYTGSQGSGQGNYSRGGGYNRNFNNRGGNQMGFQNRNFSGPAGNMGMAGGYGAPNTMGGFGGGPMGNMNQFSNFSQRGGMMGGMRGGMGSRGGRGGNMMGGGMGGMPMAGNMPMGGMGMGMGMPGMGANMGMMGMGGGAAGFSGGAQPHFNPAFFGQNQGGSGGEGNWNPHGAKRPRPE